MQPFGDLQGCIHDRGTENACGDLVDYNFGWRDPQGAFYTVMAYDCVTGQCDHNPSNNCVRIQRFSSSTVTYDGKPLGNAENDNARVLNENAQTVANYFTAVSTPAPTPYPTSVPTPLPPCILAEQPCTEWGQCCDTLFCNLQKGLCKPCIAMNSPCNRSIQCCGTNACLSGICLPCIQLGGVCSNTEDCCTGSGLSCLVGKCQLT